ncbi:MAG: hypothetical protein OXC40_06695 [Proteobacteria bacterium]|nr:hypothetical protein [Pseudomonadota bacterium]
MNTKVLCVTIFIYITSVSLSSCRLLSLETSQEKPQLKQLSDKKLDFFLAYSEDNGLYQFLTCDAKEMTGFWQSQSVFNTKQIPPYCVNAYLGQPRKVSCASYGVIQPLCAQLQPFKQHCENPEINRMPSQLEGYHCSDLEIYESQCPSVMSRYHYQCHSWYQAYRQCLDSDGEFQVCQTFRELDRERPPFSLGDPTFNNTHQIIADHFFAQEKQRELIKSKTSSVAYFGSGASFALLHNDFGKNFLQLLPNYLHWKNWSVGLPGMRLHFKSFVAFLSASSLSLPGFTPGAESFFHAFNASPYSGCIDEAAQLAYARLRKSLGHNEGTPLNRKYSLQSREYFHQELRNLPVPVALGYTSQLVIAKLSQDFHPGVKFSSLLIIPFLSAFYIHQSEKNLVSTQLAQKFNKILNPISQGGSSEQVSELKPMINLFAKLLLMTSHANLSNLDQFCYPEKVANNSYEAACHPVFDQQDDRLRQLIVQATQPDSANPLPGSCATMMKEIKRRGL